MEEGSLEESLVMTEERPETRATVEGENIQYQHAYTNVRGGSSFSSILRVLPDNINYIWGGACTWMYQCEWVCCVSVWVGVTALNYSRIMDIN